MPPAPKIESFIHFEPGVLVMCTGGRNIGRVGVILNRERHHGGFDIVHVRDVKEREFSTRIGNIFVRVFVFAFVSYELSARAGHR